MSPILGSFRPPKNCRGRRLDRSESNFPVRLAGSAWLGDTHRGIHWQVGDVPGGGRPGLLFQSESEFETVAVRRAQVASDLGASNSEINLIPGTAQARQIAESGTLA